MKDCNNCKHKMCWEYAEPCSSCTNMTGEPTNWEPQSNADVKPAVRGEWIWEENERQYRCSACRITFDYDKTYELFDHDYQYANFCPNCGADMKGE